VRTIVCGVDGSDGSSRALRVAEKLAEKLALDLVLVYVAPRTEVPGVSAMAAGQQRLHDEELRDAERLLEDLARAHDLDTTVRRRAEIGPTAERIIAVCAEERAELVVLGSRGHAGLKALLGSVSSKVASDAPCPCVVVPRHAGERFLD